MYLTEDRLHDAALDARQGLRECLASIELHHRLKERAFLNPAMVIAAAATWERFATDLVFASEVESWQIEHAGWYKGEKRNDKEAPDAAIPWPGCSKERETWRTRSQTHELDYRLMEAGVLPVPLTASWSLYVATGWFGADPTDWQLANYADDAGDGGTNITRKAILGAKSARDAGAHRLYYKKAANAQGFRRKNASDNDVDLDDWCYVWQSDNTGRPTVQSGYARGVVALFLQLIDQSIRTVRTHNGWTSKDSQVPSEWFRAKIPTGRFADLEPWGGQDLAT